MRIAMVHKKQEHEKEEPRRYEHGTYYPIGDDETEMRRRSRSAYEDGYADAMRRARMMRDEEDEMRRRSRSHHEEHDEPDMRRGRRSRSMYDEEDNEPDMRRRSRSCYDEHDEPDMRRGRRSRSEHDTMPWDRWGDEEHRKIGFSAQGGEHEAGHDVHGVASKIIDPRLEAILEEAAKVMENPPHTWEAYLKHKQYDGIVRMEGKELIRALEEGKDAKDVRKELVHTIASMFFLMSK